MSTAQSYDAVAAVCELADDLTRTIEMARALAESGRSIDLTGFTDHVGLLCAKSLDLPPADGRRIRPRLIALSGCIEMLSRALAPRITGSD